MTVSASVQWLVASLLILSCTAQFRPVNSPPRILLSKLTGSAANSSSGSGLEVVPRRNTTAVGINPVANSSSSTRPSRKLGETDQYLQATRQHILSDAWTSPLTQASTYQIYAYSSDCVGMDDYAQIGNYTDSQGITHWGASVDTITTDYLDMLDSSANKADAAVAFKNHTAALFKQAADIGRDVLDNTISHTSSNDHLNLMRYKKDTTAALIDTELIGGGQASVSLTMDGEYWLDGADWDQYQASGNDTTPLYNEWRKSQSLVGKQITIQMWENHLNLIFATYSLYYFGVDGAARWGGSSDSVTNFSFLTSLSNAVLAASISNVLQSVRATLRQARVIHDLLSGDIAEAEEPDSSNEGSGTTGWKFKVSQDLFRRWTLIKRDDAILDSSWTMPEADGSLVKMKFLSILDGFQDNKDVCT